jgi:hypothetical protein
MAFENCLLHPHQNPPHTAYVNYSASVGVWHEDGLPCSSESWTHEVEIRREIPTAVTKQGGACCSSPAAICYATGHRLADGLGRAEPHRNLLASSPCVVSRSVPFRHGRRLPRQLALEIAHFTVLSLAHYLRSGGVMFLL